MKKYGVTAAILLALVAICVTNPLPVSATLLNPNFVAGLDAGDVSWNWTTTVTKGSATILGSTDPYLQLQAPGRASGGAVVTVSGTVHFNKGDSFAGSADLVTFEGTNAIVSILSGGTRLLQLNLLNNSGDWSWAAPNNGDYLITFSLDGGNNKNKSSTATIDATYTAVPIPASALLLGSGLISLIAVRRRRK